MDGAGADQKILIADDHDIVREAVARVLTADMGARVTTVADAESAMKAIAMDGPFAIILLDVSMAGMTGVDVVRRIAQANEPGAVVIFSGVANDDFVARAIESGARGHIPKTQSLASLPDAIRLISSGTVFVPFNGRPRYESQDSGEGLSDKQLRVLRLVSQGLSNKEIALHLGMTEVTVKMHMRNICSRLGIKNRTQTAMFARDAGMLL